MIHPTILLLFIPPFTGGELRHKEVWCLIVYLVFAFLSSSPGPFKIVLIMSPNHTPGILELAGNFKRDHLKPLVSLQTFQ